MLPVCVPLYRGPISSLDVPIHTNEAYELVKQAGKGDKGEMRGGRGGRGGGVARGRGEEEEYDYVVVSAHPPVQPVAAGEGVYEYIP